MSIVSVLTGADSGLALARSQRVGLVIRVGATSASTVVGHWLAADVISDA